MLQSAQRGVSRVSTEPTAVQCHVRAFLSRARRGCRCRCSRAGCRSRLVQRSSPNFESSTSLLPLHILIPIRTPLFMHFMHSTHFSGRWSHVLPRGAFAFYTFYFASQSSHLVLLFSSYIISKCHWFFPHSNYILYSQLSKLSILLSTWQNNVVNFHIFDLVLVKKLDQNFIEFDPKYKFLKSTLNFPLLF